MRQVDYLQKSQIRTSQCKFQQLHNSSIQIYKILQHASYMFPLKNVGGVLYDCLHFCIELLCSCWNKHFCIELLCSCWNKHFCIELLCSCWNKHFNPLNAELNPICNFLALLGAHHFLHVNRMRVKSLILRLLMLYIYIYIYIYI